MTIYLAEMSRSVFTCQVDTRTCFDANHTEINKSPIDRFFETETELNRLCTPNQIHDTPIIGGLTLLGSFSSVESYIREVIREIILIDRLSQKACESQSLTFGAARVHNLRMMPEAIMENYSFVSEYNIKEALKNMLGIEKNKYTRDLITLFNSFNSICQMRHCIVHRAGKLGTRNAIALDLESHQNCIEKPLKISYSNVQEILQTNGNLVIGLNNFLFGYIITRYMDSPDPWKWDFRKDRKRFIPIYKLFYSDIWSPNPTKSAKEIYNDFRTQKQ